MEGGGGVEARGVEVGVGVGLDRHKNLYYNISLNNLRGCVLRLTRCLY